VLADQDGTAPCRVECGCGFAVEGGEDEVVEAARRHAEAVHGLELADGIVRALARPVTSGARRRRGTTSEG
jgi:hypothetical protein